MEEDIFAGAFAEANGLKIEKEFSENNDNNGGADNKGAAQNPANQQNNQQQNQQQNNQQQNQQQSGNDGSSAGQNNQTTPAPSFEELLVTNSKGKFKKIEDVEKAIDDAAKAAFATEKVQKLNDFIKAGGTFEDFAKTQLTDYTKLSDNEKIKERMKLTDPYLTDEELDVLIASEYTIAEDASDIDKKMVDIRRKRAAKEAENILIENQKKWAVQDVDPETARQEAAQNFEKWKTQFYGSIDKSDKLELTIGEKDTDKMHFEIKKELKDSVKQKYTNLSEFWNRYQNADGSDNVEKLVNDLYILENFNSIIKTVAGFAKTQGREELINERKNPNYTGDNVNTNNGVETIEDQIAKNAPRF